jgi:trimeric autotransporter adhesin
MKMKSIIFLLSVCMFCVDAMAQQAVGIGTNSPNASSMLEVNSSSKGLLIPRVSLTGTTDITTIANPANALLLYNNNPALPDGRGFYYWNSVINAWTRLATNTNLNNIPYWSHDGNSGTDPAVNFIGTTDNRALLFKTNNILSGKIDPGPNNVFFGQSAGIATTSGTNNTFLGHQAGISDTSGANNLFIGHLAGNLNSNGNENVFVGQEAGKVNTTGSRNVFVGEDAGISNTAGNDHIFIGNGAARNTTGAFGLPMVAIGSEALAAATSSSSSIAIGHHSLTSATFGTNVAMGYMTLENSTIGDKNTAMGTEALRANTTGNQNTALGHFALNNNTTGYGNIGIGYRTLEYNTTGNINTAMGYLAGPPSGSVNLSNTTCIGYGAEVTTGNTMVFGNFDVNRFAFGLTTTNAQHVIEVGANSSDGNGAYLTQGGNWTNTSSRIKKEDFSNINAIDLLQKIQHLPIQKWKYKGTNEYHIGPVAEDFYELFKLGTDDKGISTVDPAGIALAAIKELIVENNLLKQELQKIKETIDALKTKR